MALFDQPGAWSRWNATQRDRVPRPLVHALLRHAGDGDGRLALDLGCGAGVEAELLLRRGWRVLAVDGDPEAGPSLAARLPAGLRAGLEVLTADFADLPVLPPLDLVHAGWSLPYAGRSLPRVWHALLTALVPGGWLGGELFGDRDGPPDATDVATLSDAQLDRLLAPLTVVQRDTQEADGESPSGPHHWHVHTVVARRPLV